MNSNYKIPIYSTVVVILVAINCLAQQVQADAKVDCHPIEGATKEKCETLGCVWSPVKSFAGSNGNISKLPFNETDEAVLKIEGGLTAKSNIEESWCYFPINYVGYKVISSTPEYFLLSRDRPTVFGNDIENIRVELVRVDQHTLRVKIHDRLTKRFEPELPELNIKGAAEENSINNKQLFDYKYSIKESELIVIRGDTGARVFNTDLSRLIFSDQFIQLNTELNSPFVFGLGEHYDSFLKRIDKNKYKSYSFYNTDKLPLPEGRRSYGGFPFYINLDSENQTNAHGVYLHNSNAKDIVLQSDQSMTFRTTGGILDFFIFFGPTPNEVIQQYQQLVGFPTLPPRWSLGFHLCRYGYKTLDKTRLVWQRTRDSGIPFDVQWNDIDNMERHNDFTFDHERFAKLPEFIDELHKNDMHYMLLFDPGLSQEDNYYPYELGREKDIFVKNSTNQVLVGKVWNDSGKTVFPDFSNPASHAYWSELFKRFQQEIKFDGAWIDMNDISNFVYGSLDGCPKENYLEKAPYKVGGYDLQTNSLCLSAKHKAGSEYDVHNLYSFYESIATYKALQASRPNKRPFIISRSTFPGQNRYSGHWSGDVLSNWDYLRWSIPSLIEHSMYGFSMMGTDICGFTGNSNPELCARWSTLGAFYTFSRNHNDDVSIDQDPVALGPEVVEANKNALRKKYSLLPYLYSLLHRASKFGEPVIQSIPFEFFQLNDKETLQVEYQFLWGKGLMISPIVEQGTYSKKTYLPRGRWYETNVKYWNQTSTGKNHYHNPTTVSEIKIPKWIDSKGEWYETKDVSLSDIPLFYRGGFIMPIYTNVEQTIAKTVANQPYGLEVALDSDFKAQGELYIDDGDNVDGKFNHVNMHFDRDSLIISLDSDDYVKTVEFGQVFIYGISSKITGVKVNNQSISFKRSDHILSIDLRGVVTLNKSQDILVQLVKER